MHIKSFCVATGLPRETVRFYIKLGLLVPQLPSSASNNRYQVFDDAQIERAKVIKLAKSLGFSLKEIVTLAQAYESVGITIEQRSELLNQKVQQLEQKMELLATMRGYLLEKLDYLQNEETGIKPVLCVP